MNYTDELGHDPSWYAELWPDDLDSNFSQREAADGGRRYITTHKFAPFQYPRLIDENYGLDSSASPSPIPSQVLQNVLHVFAFPLTELFTTY